MLVTVYVDDNFEMLMTESESAILKKSHQNDEKCHEYIDSANKKMICCH